MQVASSKLAASMKHRSPSFQGAPLWQKKKPEANLINGFLWGFSRNKTTGKAPVNACHQGLSAR